jgi:hypothetical protein
VGRGHRIHLAHAIGRPVPLAAQSRERACATAPNDESGGGKKNRQRDERSRTHRSDCNRVATRFLLPARLLPAKAGSYVVRGHIPTPESRIPSPRLRRNAAAAGRRVPNPESRHPGTLVCRMV